MTGAWLYSILALSIAGSSVDLICSQSVNIVKMCMRCGCCGLEPPLWVLYSVMNSRQDSLVGKRGTPFGNWVVASSLGSLVEFDVLFRICNDK